MHKKMHNTLSSSDPKNRLDRSIYRAQTMVA
jgi:hypothetical protein